jgi:hypothetical protein
MVRGIEGQTCGGKRDEGNAWGACTSFGSRLADPGAKVEKLERVGWVLGWCIWRKSWRRQLGAVASRRFTLMAGDCVGPGGLRHP